MSALRLAKYTNTPVYYYLSLDIEEFCIWVQTVNKEIEAENKAIKNANRKK